MERMDTKAYKNSLVAVMKMMVEVNWFVNIFVMLKFFFFLL